MWYNRRGDSDDPTIRLSFSSGGLSVCLPGPIRDGAKTGRPEPGGRSRRSRPTARSATGPGRDVLDARSGIEFSFQNDGRKLWILAVVKDPRTLESLESTGMTVLAGPAKGKKPARGVLFLVRRIPAESYIYWRESQGKLLSDAEKEKIRKAGPQDDTFAFAVGARGSTQGPLRNSREGAPPEFGFSGGPGGAVYEFEIPLDPPDLVPGGLGARPGEIPPARVRLGRRREEDPRHQVRPRDAARRTGRLVRRRDPGPGFPQQLRLSVPALPGARGNSPSRSS